MAKTPYKRFTILPPVLTTIFSPLNNRLPSVKTKKVQNGNTDNMAQTSLPVLFEPYMHDVMHTWFPMTMIWSENYEGRRDVE